MKKIIALIMASAMLLSLGTVAFADETDYYALETNADGSDPVYILLDDTNSTVNTETGELTYKQELQQSDKEYSVVSNTHGDTKVYEITAEETDVADLTVNQEYSFVKGGGAAVGDMIEAIPEGGAQLKYLGDGKSTEVSDNARYTTVSDTVSEIFQNDIAMIEEFTAHVEQVNSCESADDYALMMLKEELAYYDVPEEDLTKITTLDEYVETMWELYKDEGYSKEDIKAEVEEYYLPWFKSEYNRMAGMADGYKTLLEEMKAVDANDQNAILEYLGLHESEFMMFKKNLAWSNTPVVKNSGIVQVVTPGEGFDTCEQGAIFYREELGWSYACTNGGVGFGDATDLHLYEIETHTLSADAFSVEAGDAVQLDKDGKGVAGLKNVKAYVQLPGSTEKSEIISFEFKEDYVELDKDAHVTAIIGGRYYTVKLDLLKWAENPTEDIPVYIEPVVNPIVSLSNDLNNDLFGSIVKNVDYADEAYSSKAEVADRTLCITAVFDGSNVELRRACFDSKLINEIIRLNVDVKFVVGSYTVTISAEQLKGLDNVIITVDPETGICTITVDGVDRTADFIFDFTNS